MNYCVILDYFGILSTHNKSFKTGYKDRNLFIPHAMIKEAQCRIDNFVERSSAVDAKELFKVSMRSVFLSLCQIASQQFDSNDFITSSTDVANITGLTEDTVNSCIGFLKVTQLVYSQTIQLKAIAS